MDYSEIFRDFDVYVKDDQVYWSRTNEKLHIPSSFDRKDQLLDTIARAAELRFAHKYQLTKREFDYVKYPQCVSGYFYHTKNAFETEAPVVILILGLGSVRPGCWSRKLASEDGFVMGGMDPQLDEIIKRGWEAIILYPNHVHESISYCSPYTFAHEHTDEIYHMFLSHMKSSAILFFAHSAGGGVLSRLLEEHRDLLDKVVSIALTDSSFSTRPGNERLIALIKSGRVRNYMCSSAPVGTLLQRSGGNSVMLLSAGHTFHPSSNYYATSTIFSQYEHHLSPPTPSPPEGDSEH